MSALVVALALAPVGCTFNPPRAGSSGSGATSGGGATGGGGTGGSAMPVVCKGLQCQQTSCQAGNCTVPPCTGGARTTVSGTIYDPAGKVPLYNVTVYVPNAPLDPIADGASCDRCDTALSGSPIAKTTTDAAGKFTLENVPVGSGIPMVIQVGKWRREVTLSGVAACADTPLTDVNMTRLPRNQGEGHIPKIALTTGHADALECLLRKIGIEDAEFTPESGSGRVNLFAGDRGTNLYTPTLNAGAMFTAAPGWWDDASNLKKYDVLLHSCEGIERSVNKSAAALQAFQDYADVGGRVFASHWHNYWIEHGTAPLQTVARFNHQRDPQSPFTATIDTSFPKGAALAQWLTNVRGSTTPGQLVIQGAKHTVDSVTANLAQRWIFSAMPASVQYFTFNTPVAAAAAGQCGKVVFSDLHVSAGTGAATDDASDPTLAFPTGCRTTELSPQEKALEFMLFDLSACLDPVVM